MEYQLKCEIQCCQICNEWIDQTNKLVIINRKHYHKKCIISLYREFSHTQKLVLCSIPCPPYQPPCLHSLT